MPATHQCPNPIRPCSHTPILSQLVHKYQGIIVPPCPPKDAVGTGVMKMKGAGDITPFIERRQYALQRFLRRLASHPILVVDENVVAFFETDAKM